MTKPWYMYWRKGENQQKIATNSCYMTVTFFHTSHSLVESIRFDFHTALYKISCTMVSHHQKCQSIHQWWIMNSFGSAKSWPCTSGLIVTKHLATLQLASMCLSSMWQYYLSRYGGWLCPVCENQKRSFEQVMVLVNQVICLDSISN